MVTPDEERVTLDDLHATLLMAGHDVPRDRRKFQVWIWNLTRAGRLPQAVRGPRPDGKRGTLGLYPISTFDTLVEIIRTKNASPVLREHMPRLPKSADPNPIAFSEFGPFTGERWQQRQVSLSLWVPEPLAVEVEGLVREGQALGNLLFYGFFWLSEAPASVRKALLKPYAEKYGLPPSDPWKQFSVASYLCALDLAARGFKVIDELKRKHDISLDEATSRWKLKFKVTADGRIEVSAVEPVGRVPVR